MNKCESYLTLLIWGSTVYPAFPYSEPRSCQTTRAPECHEVRTTKVVFCIALRVYKFQPLWKYTDFLKKAPTHSECIGRHTEFFLER